MEGDWISSLSTSLGGDPNLSDLHGGDATIAIVGSILGVGKTLGVGVYWWEMCGVSATCRSVGRGGLYTLLPKG